MPTSPVKDCDGVIADGAIRSGKTLSMSLSFVMWAMESFDQHNFAMCGKTIGSFRRNVLTVLKLMLRSRGYGAADHRADNMLVISRGGKTNYFYIFGGKDERSQDLIQGITLAGIFFDEVALMPESFVSQGTGRCSVDGSKYWFNCNPAGPYHWFKVNWINKAKDKKLLYLHFTMDDNLSLTEKIKERYGRMYAGVFFKRYILGLWVMAEGIIYDMFDDNIHAVDILPLEFDYFTVAIDYGTSNITTFVLLGHQGTVDYVIDEYYYDAQKSGRQKTDVEFADDFASFVDPYKSNLKYIFYDTNAASLAAELRVRGWRQVHMAYKGPGSVIAGIREVSSKFNRRLLFIHRRCTNVLREISSYIWDSDAQERGEDKPLKQHDHSLDAIRYDIYTRHIYNQVQGQNGSRVVLSAADLGI